MANRSIEIPAKTFVDVTATASLTAGSYIIQPAGASVYLDEQATTPADTSNSLFVSSGGAQTITQQTENFYVYALEPCRIVIAESS